MTKTAVREGGQTKEFSTLALASISSGIMLCRFGEMAECAEWLLGGSIWTHQYPRLADKLEAAVLAQFPEFPKCGTIPSGEAWERHAQELNQKFGSQQIVKRGDGSALMSPFEGLPKHAEVIALRTDILEREATKDFRP